MTTKSQQNDLSNVIVQTPEEEEEEEKPFLLKLCDAKRRLIIYRFLYRVFAQSPLVRHLLWLMILIGYSVAGGEVFRVIEGAHDVTQLNLDYAKKVKSFETHRNSQTLLIKRMQDIVADNTYRVRGEITMEEHKMELLLEQTDWYDNQMGIRVDKPVMGYTKWDFLGGIHYAMSIYTTTGYGDITPKTKAGKVATIIYAIIGVPIMVVVMGDLGNMLYVLFQSIWIKVVTRCRNTLRKATANELEETTVALVRQPSISSIHSTQKSQPMTPLLQAHAVEDVIQIQQQQQQLLQQQQQQHAQMVANAAMTRQAMEEAKYEEQALLNLPMWVALIILVGWITFSSSMVSLWEPEWTYFNAIYFYITSLTTIGLGDVVPSTPYKFLLAHLATLLVGLSMMSMFINIFNARVGLLYDRLLYQVDKEYRTRQVEPEFSLMKSAGSIGADEKSAIEGLRRLYESRPLSDRIMYYLMGEHRQRLLADQWMKRTNMINRRMQTTPLRIDKAVQTGMKSAEEKKKKRGSDDDDDDEDADSSIYLIGGAKHYGKGREPKKRQVIQKKYVYHIFD